MNELAICEVRRVAAGQKFYDWELDGFWSVDSTTAAEEVVSKIPVDRQAETDALTQTSDGDQFQAEKDDVWIKITSCSKNGFLDQSVDAIGWEDTFGKYLVELAGMGTEIIDAKNVVPPVFVPEAMRRLTVATFYSLWWTWSGMTHDGRDFDWGLIGKLNIGDLTASSPCVQMAPSWTKKALKCR